jgi:hypothetical protein
MKNNYLIFFPLITFFFWKFTLPIFLYSLVGISYAYTHLVLNITSIFLPFPLALASRAAAAVEWRVLSSDVGVLYMCVVQ